MSPPKTKTHPPPAIVVKPQVVAPRTTHAAVRFLPVQPIPACQQTTIGLFHPASVSIKDVAGPQVLLAFPQRRTQLGRHPTPVHQVLGNLEVQRILSPKVKPHAVRHEPHSRVVRRRQGIDNVSRGAGLGEAQPRAAEKRQQQHCPCPHRSLSPHGRNVCITSPNMPNPEGDHHCTPGSTDVPSSDSFQRQLGRRAGLRRELLRREKHRSSSHPQKFTHAFLLPLVPRSRAQGLAAGKLPPPPGCQAPRRAPKHRQPCERQREGFLLSLRSKAKHLPPGTKRRAVAARQREANAWESGASPC